ncbi:hypothetical protein M422DRAFT_277052 [Sphaerobolus stellatus SS14]|uniref:Uncharacterized protein n=1 Tax=Sphaerobolus stellatus (strain SS14) TaxID=990650 RepID=A0A0C9UAH1_SPHS4|nr:hypothetical protein M422DRAFT_277052 [Sphaerobolus stellatus SS14]
MSALNQPINPPASQDQQKELARKSSLTKDDDLSSTLSSLEKTNPAIKSDLALPRPTPKWINLIFRSHKLQAFGLDAIATEVAVFEDPILAPHYQPTAEYENAHQFDLSARWTYREEKVR